MKSTDPRTGKIPGAGGDEQALGLLPAGAARCECWGPPKRGSRQHRSGGMEAGASHGWSSGPSRARGGGAHPFAVLTRSSSPLCAGVPKGAGGRSGPTPSSDGQRGRSPEGSCRPELGGGGRGLGARVTPPPPGGLGRGRAPSADSCRSLQPPAKQQGPDPARLPQHPQGYCPPWAAGTARGGSPSPPLLARDEGCLLLGCPTLHVCRCSPAPIFPRTVRVSLGRACRSSTCKAGGWLPSEPFTADKIQFSLPCAAESVPEPENKLQNAQEQGQAASRHGQALPRRAACPWYTHPLQPLM